jgi:NAD(P)-dependent dehydrogenase (short-subunit alcohol dehydrogenase family)
MGVAIDLFGARVLVVGGSAGIGRSTALAAAHAGAAIAVVGRSEEKLKEVVASAGSGTAIAADVRDPDRCAGLVVEAASTMGGLDAVVISSAVSPLAPLDEVSAATWQDVMTTNAIAPALIAQATLEHLSDDGVIVFISSITVGSGHHGLSSYAASKAALDRTVRAWRLERPDHRFVCIAVGDTIGTEFTRDFDADTAAELFPKWLAASVIHQNHMESDDLGRTITELVAVLLAHPGLTFPELTIVPPGPMMTLDPAALATMLEDTVGTAAGGGDPGAQP